MRDSLLIYAAAFLRSSSVGLIGVVLAIALTEAGVSVAGTGVVIGAGLVGIAAMTLVVTVAADRIGRRRTLIAVSLLTGFGYFAAAASSRLLWLIPAAFVGMLNGMGRDRGPALLNKRSFLRRPTRHIAPGPSPGTTWCSTEATRSAASRRLPSPARIA